MPTITGKGIKAFMIAALAIFAAHINDDAIIARHISDGAVEEAALATNSVSTSKIVDLNVTAQKLADDAIIARHISDGAINATDMLGDDVVSEQKLSGAVRAKLNGALPYAKEARDPGVSDDAANGGGVTWVEGNAASLRAKWYNTSTNQLWECVNPTAGAAEWVDITNLEAGDFGDLAFMDKTTLESTINITSSRVSDFNTSVKAAGEGFFAKIGATNTFTEANTFDAGVTFGDTISLGGVSLSAVATFNDGLAADAASASDSEVTTQKYVHGAIEAAKEAIETDNDAALAAQEVSRESFVLSTEGATELVYTSGGTELLTLLMRGGVDMISAGLAVHDPAQKKYTFTSYPVGAEDDDITFLRVYKGNA